MIVKKAIQYTKVIVALKLVLEMVVKLHTVEITHMEKMRLVRS